MTVGMLVTGTYSYYVANAYDMAPLTSYTEYPGRASAITNVGTTKQLTASIWFYKPTLAAFAIKDVCTSGNTSFEVILQADGTPNNERILITVGNNSQYATSYGAVGSGWNHLLLSVDLSSSSLRGVILNGSPLSDGGWTAYVNQNIAAPSTYYIGNIGSRNNENMASCMSDHFIYIGGYTDLSVTANVRKFRTLLGKPVDLGSTGSNPFGVQPQICFTSPVSGAWQNRGNGGAFSSSNGLIYSACGTSPSS